MQTKKNVSPEEQKLLDKLCFFLAEMRSVHLGRIKPEYARDERFCLAFDLQKDCPFTVSSDVFRGLWIQVTLEPQYAFLAMPVSWYAGKHVLTICPRRDREDLDVYATIALERGGDPRVIKLGVPTKNLFRTFIVAPTH